MDTVHVSGFIACLCSFGRTLSACRKVTAWWACLGLQHTVRDSSLILPPPWSAGHCKPPTMPASLGAVRTVGTGWTQQAKRSLQGGVGLHQHIS